MGFFKIVGLVVLVAWMYDYYCLLDSGINIHIHKIGQDSFDLTAHPLDSPIYLSLRTFWYTGILPWQQALYFNQKPLSGSTLQDSGVREGTVVQMVMTILAVFRYDGKSFPVAITTFETGKFIREGVKQLFHLPVDKMDIYFQGSYVSDVFIESTVSAKLDARTVYLLDVIPNRDGSLSSPETRYDLYLRPKKGYLYTLWLGLFKRDTVYNIQFDD